jgi:hypothetical protein
MSVLKTLRERLAPELNYLYLAPPSEVSDSLDCGWHGHEHALHAFFVARMFGATAELCSGDFAIISRSMPPVTSVGREPGHGWCSINEVAPVDLGMTFHYFGQVPQLRAPIIGEGPNGDWRVTYAEDESVLDENIESGNEILFIEKQLHRHTAPALIENPFLFLPPPRPDDPNQWSAQFGPSVFAKISVHCFDYARGEAKSIRNRMKPLEAVAWIAENYPSPETRIVAALK